MFKFILRAYLLIHISWVHAAESSSLIQHESDEPAMMHWSRLHDYMASRGAEKSYLVIEVGQVQTGPFVSQCSNAKALKIRILNEGVGSQFFPDIDSFLSWQIPPQAKEAFHEVHIQRSQKGQEDFYPILFMLLKSGGKLFDYRFLPQVSNVSDTQNRIQRALEQEGFIEVGFELRVDDLLYQQQHQWIISAQKSEGRAFSTIELLSPPVRKQTLLYGSALLYDPSLVEYLRNSRRVEFAEPDAPLPSQPDASLPSQTKMSRTQTALKKCIRYMGK